MKTDIKILAFYLPQFHPTPENDLWWGKGFTEWTNVTKAKPLFRNHYQPKLPKDLGFYDLRVPETRLEQATMAKEYGISAFCYWHYWFGNGRRLLNKPFDEVLESGQPDFPFCLAWANSSWQGFDYGCNNERNLLIKQEYPGTLDYINHFNTVLPAFKDSRYFKIDGKPVFLIFQPTELPDCKKFIKLWQTLAIKNGLEGIFFIAQTENDSILKFLLEQGFDAINTTRFFHSYNLGVSKLKKRLSSVLKLPKVLQYRKAVKYFVNEIDREEYCFPTVYPNWDHSARSGKRALILQDSRPKYFYEYLMKLLNNIKFKKINRQVVFIKSWNEWAEGNYLEPDFKYGYGYLEAIRQCLEDLK